MQGETINVRALQRDDYRAWLSLWNGYNEFYGRIADHALPESITATTWHRFFNPLEPVFALVAEDESGLLGLTHYLYHRSTTRIEPVCYLQDLFTAPTARGRGVARALVDRVQTEARAGGARRVYWQTLESNARARHLYDKIARHHGFIVYASDLS